MRIELANDIKELASAMDALKSFSGASGLDEAASQAAELVLDELLCNIICYGGGDGESQPIVLELDVVADSLRIRITDAGIPFNPFDKAPPELDVPLEQCKIGGLGIHLVKHCMDEYDYVYRDNHNIVTLSKKLAAAAN